MFSDWICLAVPRVMRRTPLESAVMPCLLLSSVKVNLLEKVMWFFYEANKGKSDILRWALRVYSPTLSSIKLVMWFLFLWFGGAMDPGNVSWWMVAMVKTRRRSFATCNQRPPWKNLGRLMINWQLMTWHRDEPRHLVMSCGEIWHWNLIGRFAMRL